MKTETLYRDDSGYLFRYFDDSSSVWVLGVEVYKWSPSIARKFFKVMGDVVSNSDSYYFSIVKGPKEKKFNEMFGFQSTGITTKIDGIEYEVMYV